MSYQVVPPNHIFDVTLTIEQGLLLPANPLMRFIVQCALARAVHQHPIKICHYLVEASHIHLLIVVSDPDLIKDFKERFKTETAHYINNMLGREQVTVWREKENNIPVLTLSSVMNKIKYIYTNPAKDNLTSSIEEFPGLNSWSAYKTGRHKKVCPRLHRPMMPYLPKKSYPEGTYKRHIRELRLKARSSHVLELEPDAWMDFFGIDDADERKLINKKIKWMVQQEEEHFEEIRKKEGKKVMGRHLLATEHLNVHYLPERSGRKTWCICDNKQLRIDYIRWAKALKRKAKEVYTRWKRGDFSVKYPPGVYPPRVPKLANMTQLAMYPVS